ncbi:hypothetical protein ACGFX2_31780 [Streptomyces goshikiensis]
MHVPLREPLSARKRLEVSDMETLVLMALIILVTGIGMRWIHC